MLNNIHLFGSATPMLYVWFPLTFHRNTPHWAALLWSFALGLAIDVFSNTPGLAAGSLTLIGMMQPYLLELFVPRDSVEEMEVSASTLGLGKYALLCAILLIVFCWGVNLRADFLGYRFLIQLFQTFHLFCLLVGCLADAVNLQGIDQFCHTIEQ